LHRRVLVSAEATFLVDGMAHPAHCLNLSMGGAGLRSNARVAAGTVLRVAIDVGGGRRIQASAEVVRTNGAEVGARFIQLDPASMVAILSAVR
jgi:hypothetical protein